jgi:hypothetical protein
VYGGRLLERGGRGWEEMRGKGWWQGQTIILWPYITGNEVGRRALSRGVWEGRSITAEDESTTAAARTVWWRTRQWGHCRRRRRRKYIGSCTMYRYVIIMWILLLVEANAISGDKRDQG